jgi:hypothetical protein
MISSHFEMKNHMDSMPFDHMTDKSRPKLELANKPFLNKFCNEFTTTRLANALLSNQSVEHICSRKRCLVHELGLRCFDKFDLSLQDMLIKYLENGEFHSDEKYFEIETLPFSNCDHIPNEKVFLKHENLACLHFLLQVIEPEHDDLIEIYRKAIFLYYRDFNWFKMYIRFIAKYLVYVRFDRENDWHLQTRTFSGKSTDIYAEDFIGQDCFGDLNRWTSRNFRRFLLSYDNLIRLSSRGQKKFLKRSLKACYYSRYLDLSIDSLTANDDYSQFDIDRYHRLRKFIGLGYDMEPHTWTAETAQDDATSLGIIKTVTEWVNGFWKKTDGIRTFISSPFKWFQQIFEKMFSSFLPFIKHGFTGIGSKASSAFKWYDQLVETVSKAFSKVLKFPSKIIDKAYDLIKSSTILIASLIVIALGFVGGHLVDWISRIIGHRATSNVTLNFYDHKFSAESPDGVVSIAAVTLALFNWGLPTREKITSWCGTLMKLVAAGTIIKYAGVYLISFLPSVIRNAITYEFGDEQTKFELCLDEWRIKVSALLTASKNATVLTSQVFRTRLVECIEESAKMRDIKNISPHLRAIFVSHYLKLINLRSIISQYENTETTRPLPFSMHMYAPPGTGKTLIATRLMKMLGATDEDIYTMPKSDYMDAYMGQRYIIWDEFLNGNAERIDKEAEIYLQMISTGVFIPELPSVDNVNSGIKGTPCSPKVVITMSNDHSKTVAGYDSKALFRRRNFALKISLVPRTHLLGTTGNVDMGKYTLEQRKNLEWIRGSFEDPIKSSVTTLETDECLGFRPDHKFSFTEFGRIILNKHRKHMELIQCMAEASGASDETQKTPGLVIDELMREFVGIPNEKVSLKDLFLQFMVSTSLPNLSKTIYNKAYGLFSAEMLEVETTEPQETPSSQRKIRSRKKKRDSVPKETVNDDVDSKVKRDESSDTFKSVEEDTEHMQVSSDSDDDVTTIETAFSDMVVLSEYIDLTARDADVVDELTNDIDKYVETETFVASLKHSKDKYQHLIGTEEVIPSATPNPTKPWIYMWFDFSIMIMLALLLRCIVKYVKGVFFGTDEQVEQEEDDITYAHYQTSGEPKAKQTKRSNRPTQPMRGFTRGSYVSQAGAISLARFHIDDVVVTAVPLGNRRFLSVYHWGLGRITSADQVLTATVTHLGRVYESVEIVVSRDIVSVHDKDYCIINLGHVKKMPLDASIVGRFITNAELLRMPKRFNLGVISTTKDNYGPASLMSSDCRYRVMSKGVFIDFMNIQWAVKAKIPSTNGDCGNLAYFYDTPLANKLLGIHVAGSDNKTIDPSSIISVITKEDLMAALSVFDGKVVEESFNSESGESVHPNLLRVADVPEEDIVYIPDTSVIAPTILQGLLPVTTEKQPAIMSRYDVRANGKDPVEASLENLFAVSEPNPVMSIVDDVFDSMTTFYQKKLMWPMGRRVLTQEEAIRGVPGILSSINTATSPGYPLVISKRLKGKTDHIRISSEDYWVSDMFQSLLDDRLKQMETYDGTSEIDHRFIGYLKDETLSKKKIDEVRTRMIFCNSAVSAVAFRMKVGSLLAAFTNSWQRVPISIGMNPNSWDFDDIYQNLSKVGDRFLSADFKSFDQRHVRVIRERAYKLLRDLLGDLVTDEEWNFIYDHETKSPLQIKDKLYWIKSNHFSGCFFTTILNCLVSEAYIRYCFTRLDPDLIYWRDYRIKTLGDDNIISISDKVTFTPLDLQSMMLEVNQDFTHSLKDQQLTENWSSFDQINFLGTQPRMVNGFWAGAQLKSSLWETVQWQHSKIADLREVVEQCMEKCSIWDRDFFDYYCNSINSILEDHLIKPVVVPYLETQRKVCRAKTKPSTSLFAHSDDPIRATLPSVGGLTTMTTETGFEQSMENEMNQRDLISRNAINEERMGLDFGLNSIIYRDRVVWNSASSGVIYSVDIPFGLLLTGEVENVQNMPFERFIYMVTHLQIFFQVNGNPFQQGLAVAYFAPLATMSNSVPSLYNIYNYHHVRIQPNESATHCLNISTQWFRSVLNTFSGGLGGDSLGYVGIYIVVPFVSVNPGQAVITVSSRFGGTGFSIPRPLPSADFIKRDKFAVARFTRLAQKLGVRPESITNYVAEGAAGSKTTTTTVYNIGDVVGSIPIQTEIGSSATASAEGSADVKASLPLDKPPLASGTIPTFSVLPCNSKNVGVEPVIAMQHHPAMMHREPMKVSNNHESSIEHLCGLPTILYSIPWSTARAANYELLNFPLNSIFRDLTSTQMFDGFEVGTPLAVLNMAMFWRADVEVTIEAIKTPFHSGRLVATLAYGAPSLTPAEKNVYYNKILNFSHDNAVEKYMIKFNAATEFLRTYCGPLALNPEQDQSMGRFMLTVHTQLAAPTTVSPDITLLVSVRLTNVHIYEANSVMPINVEDGIGTYTVEDPVIPLESVSRTETPTRPVSNPRVNNNQHSRPNTNKPTEPKKHPPPPPGQKHGVWDGKRWHTSKLVDDYDGDYVAESDGLPIPGEESEVVNPPIAEETTASEAPEMQNPTCGLDTGRKFEYSIHYMEEFIRRYQIFPVQEFADKIINQKENVPLVTFQSSVIHVPITIGNAVTSLFRMWSGHLNIRGMLKSYSIPTARLYSLSFDTQSPNDNIFATPLPSDSCVKNYATAVVGNSTKYIRDSYGDASFPNTIYRNGMWNSSMAPTEYLTPVANDYWWLNVSVPFNTHFNGLFPYQSTNQLATGISSLQQYIHVNRQVDDKIAYCSFSRAAGDDFKLQVYCPRRLWWRPLNLNGASTVNGRMYVGNFYFGDRSI